MAAANVSHPASGADVLDTTKNRLPSPAAFPALSTTPHAIVWTPSARAVVSITLYPTAPLLMISPGKRVAMSAR